MNLDKKDINIKEIVEKALEDEEILAELLDNLESKNDTIRFNSFLVLEQVSLENPHVLYPHWDFFSGLLDGNAYHKRIGVQILADLVHIDTKGKFEQILEQYYDMLSDSVIVAALITELTAKIVKAKPELEPVITAKLLDIDKTSQKHKDLIKAGAIDAFMEYYEMAENKEGIVKFVRGQLKSTSPKTKKKAKQFFEFLGEKK
ncbi:hypothetical protein JXM67_06820 [candidate division WOR-3 bacterium]|nr:hypothetical protein [candidate division WOR-3 bacterium]